MRIMIWLVASFFAALFALWRERAENRLADFHGTISSLRRMPGIDWQKVDARLAENLLCRVTCADYGFRALTSP